MLHMISMKIISHTIWPQDVKGTDINDRCPNVTHALPHCQLAIIATCHLSDGAL